MKTFFNILAFLVLAYFIYLLYLNMPVTFNFVIWDINGKTMAFKETDFTAAAIFIFLFGALCAGLWEAQFWIKDKMKLKEYQRKLEKTSVQSSEDSSKVEVLEAKIKTLEKALESALKKSE